MFHGVLLLGQRVVQGGLSGLAKRLWVVGALLFVPLRLLGWVILRSGSLEALESMIGAQTSRLRDEVSLTRTRGPKGATAPSVSGAPTGRRQRAMQQRLLLNDAGHPVVTPTLGHGDFDYLPACPG